MHMCHCSRFLVNIPPEETENTIRICFAVEQAHWHYTDFSLEENPLLPVLNMKQLLVKMLNNYSPFKHLAKRADDIIQAFKVYKSSVPVFGGLMLNAACDKVRARTRAQGGSSERDSERSIGLSSATIHVQKTCMCVYVRIRRH